MNRLVSNSILLVFGLFVLGLSQTYTTNFPAMENPISEGGRWTNGGAVGIDFRDVQTANGRAYSSGIVSGYDDCIACLSGFPADQSVQATIYRDPSYTAPGTHEVELHLRTTITAKSIRTYEMDFWFGGSILQIARWNGSAGDFTELDVIGPGPNGLVTGDVIKAQIVGSTITVYKNGNQIATCTDNVLTSGNPGMGFFVRPGGTLDKYCITSFTAAAIGGATQTGLSVTPATSSVEELLTRQFTATASYNSGPTSNVSSLATWTSTNAAVATVSSAGLATGRSAGTAKIIASYGGFKDTADLTVTASTATLDSLVIAGSTGMVAKNGTLPLSAIGYYSNGTSQDKTSSASWSSSSNTIATVSGSGVVSGVDLGNVVITASLFGKQDTVRLSVIDPPAFSKKINFQTITAAVPAGYVVDSGQTYSASRGYGWSAAQAESRERNVNADKRYDTFIKTYDATTWTLDVPSPGQYIITVAMGDPSYATSDTLKFGGQAIVAAYNNADQYTTLKDTLTVTGSQLVLSVLGAICYIDVASMTGGTGLDSRSGSHAGLALMPGNPNPFQQVTMLRYQVASPERVLIAIYDQSGRKVCLLKDGLAQPGLCTVAWDGRDQLGMRLSSGVYFARIKAGKEVISRRLLFTR
jgi:hypothetical protein